MISTINLKCRKDNHDLNAREERIFEVFLLNLAAQANACATKQNMMLNPLEKDRDVLFHHKFSFHPAISTEVYEELKSGIENRFSSAFKMCELEQIEMDFRLNIYFEGVEEHPS
ncbi:hypothetical protein [Falsibacillus albus]|uniref:Uncharacterized protein n=1 Tax=Falsibacillus albus TaxID=2478915 RepID=A0A3L7JSQ0_9BACI|nr:hypothetical protein [Falsibacillus albus]RLQ93354.1 hypothetical protein D9X91_17995 [Falsibacillus albus]